MKIKHTLWAALAAMTLSSAVAAQEIELSFGHVGAPGSLFEISANEFARRANERLEGKARVDVYGSSQLGNDNEMLQKLRLGTIEFSLPSTIMSTVTDEFGLFEMPYLVRDREHMKRIEEEVFWDVLAPAAEARGYKILAVWENGFRQVTNNLRPINTPEDLQGVKLRTPRGAWRVKMFQTYGANPSPMAFSEVFTALQTGTMDGQENPYAQIYSARLHEVQDYLSITNHVYTPAYVTVGAAHWERLPEDVRTVLEETAREVQAFVYEEAARLDSELLERIRESGTAINEADTQAFIDASAPIYEEFGETVDGGAELIEQVMALADQ
jgi:TRAP-type transport system periplasmic protein